MNVKHQQLENMYRGNKQYFKVVTFADYGISVFFSTL